MGVGLVFAIAILIMSVIIHEISHGYAAEYFGDPTARLAGRLTLNPMSHLDPVGSFVVPVITFLVGGFIFGWAKPVPYNPYNFRNERLGTGVVGAAGSVSNFLIAIIFGLLIRFADPLGIATPAFMQIASIVVFLNIILGVFNLIPIPPLDGSKVLFSILPYRLQNIQYFLERYWLVLVFFLIIFFWRFILPIVFYLFAAITGMPLAF